MPRRRARGCCLSWPGGPRSRPASRGWDAPAASRSPAGERAPVLKWVLKPGWKAGPATAGLGGASSREPPDERRLRRELPGQGGRAPDLEIVEFEPWGHGAAAEHRARLRFS